VNSISTRFLSFVFVTLIFASGARAQEMKTVSVGIVNTSADAGFLIAQANGYFKEEGLDVKLTPFASAALMIAPLASGELDVGSGTASAGLYNAFLRGVKIKVVADKGSVQQGYDYSTLLIRKDLVDSGRYKSFADLKGMTCAVAAKGAGSESALNEALKKGGLTIKDVNVVYLGFPDHLVALENKKIDCSITDEPTNTRAIEGNIAVKASPNAIYPGQQNAVMVYSDKFAQDKDVATRFMMAYIRAIRFYNDALANGHLSGPTSPAVIDILVKNTKIKDAGLYKRMTPNAANPNGTVNEVALNNDLKFFKAQGYVTGKIDVSDVVDDSFANAAVAKLGPYKPAAAGSTGSVGS
jgi:NitT/TauT family transport system substrate-binding protein